MSTVLVVEDEARIASFVSKGLRAAGLSVEVTGSGRQAVARACQEGIDLILLDVGLPDVDGFEVLERIRGQGVSTPVIMLTARSSVEDRVAGLSGGGGRLRGQALRLRGAAGTGAPAYAPPGA